MQSMFDGCTTISPDGVWMQLVTFSRNGNSSAGLKHSLGFPVITSGPPLKFTIVLLALVLLFGPQILWKCHGVGRKEMGGGLFASSIGAGTSSSKPGNTEVGVSGK